MRMHRYTVTTQSDWRVEGAVHLTHSTTSRPQNMSCGPAGVGRIYQQAEPQARPRHHPAGTTRAAAARPPSKTATSATRVMPIVVVVPYGLGDTYVAALDADCRQCTIVHGAHRGEAAVDFIVTSEPKVLDSLCDAPSLLPVIGVMALVAHEVPMT